MDDKTPTVKIRSNFCFRASNVQGAIKQFAFQTRILFEQKQRERVIASLYLYTTFRQRSKPQQNVLIS